MSAETPRLKFQPIPEGIQVTAETWAEALNRIDAFCDLYLLGQFANTPPASPADGDAYLTGGSPSGAWTNQTYKIAACRDGGWRFYAPFNGLRAYVAPTGAFLLYLNGQWLDCSSLLSAGETSIASAATCDLGAANALFVQITGTTTITSFGTGAGKLRFVRFAQALTLTHNATTLILLGNASRTTAAGDVGLYASDASGNWRERSYFRAANGPDTLGAASLPGGGVLTAAGYLGLLAANPAYPLVVSGSVLIGDGSDGSGLKMKGQGGTVLRVFDVTNTGNVNSINFGAIGLGGDLRAHGQNFLIVSTTGNECARFVSSSARLGVNTNSPAATIDANGNIYLHQDNAFSLGGPSNRASVVYAGSGTINTSGTAAKAGLRGLNQAELAVAKTLAANVRIFRFCDAVVKKGDAARIHAGQVYEEVVAAFAAQGLDAARYGIVCRDPACKSVPRPPAADGGKGEAGEDIVPDCDETGAQKYVFGLRYSELTQFVLAGLAVRVAALEGGKP